MSEKTQSYRVEISKDYLTFAAAHFVVYDGDKVEPLHGHNYRVRVVVEGPLDENRYVVNFVPLKRTMRRLVDALDHRMLLPLHSPVVSVREEGDSIIAESRERRYIFPRADVILLPLENTTVEQLAAYLCAQLRTELVAMGIQRLDVLEIGVEEIFGQWGVCRETW